MPRLRNSSKKLDSAVKSRFIETMFSKRVVDSWLDWRKVFVIRSEFFLNMIILSQWWFFFYWNLAFIQRMPTWLHQHVNQVERHPVSVEFGSISVWFSWMQSHLNVQPSLINAFLILRLFRRQFTNELNSFQFHSVSKWNDRYGRALIVEATRAVMI